MAPFNFIRAATNTTILPPGYTNHGIEGLLCGPADWFSVLTFYGINYVAHCLTIKYYPAETLGEKIMVAILALLLPSSGITRALDAIKRYSRFRGVGELEQAAFAGALLMVVRNGDWIPHEGDCIREIMLESDVSHRDRDNGMRKKLIGLGYEEKLGARSRRARRQRIRCCQNRRC
jgi:hypothetical protein